jgi:hypothetical protein
MSTKTFIVGVYVGHRVAGWQFGRIDVSPEALSVRSWPYSRFKKRTIRREAVMAVSVKRRRTVPSFRIEDSEGVFSGIAVEMPFGAQRVLAELERCGYSLVDRR